MTPGAAALLIDSLEFRFFDILALTQADPDFRPQAADLADLEFLDTAYALTGRAEDRANNTWLRSVLLQRMGEAAAAERLIKEVRVSRDIARMGTLDRNDRVALTGAFRWLTVRLAALLAERNASAAEMFDAIEWAKGRALADQVARPGVPSLRDLVKALHGSRTHYWTLLPDKAATYWCLVTDDGVATSGFVPVSLGDIAKVASAKRIDPAGRGSLPGNRLSPVLDWRAMLAPLAAPIAAAQRSGKIRPGDQLLIAPHGSLHVFPLQELSGDDGVLGERMRVSRLHSAASTLSILAQPSKRPRRAVAIWAPTIIEADSAVHVASFEKVVVALRGHLPTEVIIGTAADVESLQQAASADTLLHLCSHGTFAERGAFNQRSQLLLSGRHTLPTLDPPQHQFGAADLLTSRLDGGHVTLQACVSGYAAANPQGDAVGLEWAFMLAGAASTLGTHWHVPAEETADFSATFYDAWLGGVGRAHAAWIAADRLRRHGSRQWSAFSLTGDWR